MDIIPIILTFGLTVFYTYMGATSVTKRDKGLNYAIVAIWFAIGVLSTIALSF